MRILVLADIDDFKWQSSGGEADLVIACGDLADSLILEAAEAYSCKTIFAVKGNHDAVTPFPPPIIDLHLRTEVFSGLTFGGLNGSWKYKPRGHFLYEQEEVARMLSTLARVDILISHNSPKGIHDKADDVHTGFEALNPYIARHKPRLLIHGHQHKNTESLIETTSVLGVYGFKLIEVR